MVFRRLVARILRPLQWVGAWLKPRVARPPLEDLFVRLESESESLVKKKIEQFNQLHEQ